MPINVSIVLRGEEYSIVEIPPQTSAIVRKQKEGLLRQVDMKVLKFIYFCYKYSLVYCGAIIIILCPLCYHRFACIAS